MHGPVNIKVNRGADKSLARPGRKQARMFVRDARDFNNIETRAVKIFPLQDKALKKIHAILTNISLFPSFLPGRAKDLSARRYKYLGNKTKNRCLCVVLLSDTCDVAHAHTVGWAKGLQTFYDKGPHWLSRAGSWAARQNITISGIPYHLNYCEIFTVRA